MADPKKSELSVAKVLPVVVLAVFALAAWYKVYRSGGIGAMWNSILMSSPAAPASSYAPRNNSTSIWVTPTWSLEQNTGGRKGRLEWKLEDPTVSIVVMYCNTPNGNVEEPVPSLNENPHWTPSYTGSCSGLRFKLNENSDVTKAKLNLTVQ